MTRSVDSPGGQQKPQSPGKENEKHRKYDRQLRLWGDHGQSAIESAHVCLINANATGTEVLKSLVLPGIGAFTLIDGHQVTAEDVGCNFFLDSNSIGSNRAKVATQLLLEMNSDVRGDYIEDTIESVLETNPNIFGSFSLVIASGLYNEKALVKLSELLWKANVPFINLKSYGLIGLMRLQINEHPVVESHPDSALEDLRIDQPFPELRSHLDSLNMDTMTRKDLSHTPYLIVLYRYLKKWQLDTNQADTVVPSNYKEKQHLRKLILDGIAHYKDIWRKRGDSEEDGDTRELDLENFDEAIKAINTVLVQSSKIPNETKKILDMVKSVPITNNNQIDKQQSIQNNNQSNRTKFWLLVRALNEYVATRGSLPLRGSLPDMTADSTRYIQLQKIYAARAKEDADHLQSIILQSSSELDLSSVDLITESDIRMFCRNAPFLSLIRTSAISSEYSKDETGSYSPKLIEKIKEADGTDCSNFVYYLLLRAVDRFYSHFNRFPGETDQDGDVVRLKGSLKEVTSELGVSLNSKDDFVHEMARFGGCELHSVAAFIGGVAAQEAIKLITGQYVPFDNTFIYNAINSTTDVYQL